MTPPPNGPAVPDPALADPMLRVLRERHPEVDVVVLPGPVPPAPDTPRLDPAVLAATAGATAAATVRAPGLVVVARTLRLLTAGGEAR
jgi:hypothetical protein